MLMSASDEGCGFEASSASHPPERFSYDDGRMTDRGTKLLNEALELPPTERAELAEQLLSSLETTSDKRIDELWAMEAEQRIDAYQRGELISTPAQQVFDEISDSKP